MQHTIYLGALFVSTVTGLGLCIGGIFLPPLLIPGATILGTAVALGLKDVRNHTHTDELRLLESEPEVSTHQSSVLFKYKYKKDGETVEEFTAENFPSNRLS